MPRLQLAARQAWRGVWWFIYLSLSKQCTFLSSICFQGMSNNKGKLKRKKNEENAGWEKNWNFKYDSQISCVQTLSFSCIFVFPVAETHKGSCGAVEDSLTTQPVARCPGILASFGTLPVKVSIFLPHWFPVVMEKLKCKAQFPLPSPVSFGVAGECLSVQVMLCLDSLGGEFSGWWPVNDYKAPTG